MRNRLALASIQVGSGAKIGGCMKLLRFNHKSERVPRVRLGCLIDDRTVGDLEAGYACALADQGDTQADAIAAAYERVGLTVRDRGPGEWPVLILSAAVAIDPWP
jgi:hypothetical protein